MSACLDESVDRFDAVLSLPEDRKVKENFDRDVRLDVSTREYEHEHKLFPANIIFNSNAVMQWFMGFMSHYQMAQSAMEEFNRFKTEILDVIVGYKLPVITLGKATPREAVCKVFENVNTGGVALTVFELVTATFATYEFDLRKDWEICRDNIWGTNDKLISDVMRSVDEAAFLTAITLYTTYLSPSSTTCKKKDVLALSFEDYQNNKDKLLAGFRMTRRFLYNQSVFRQRDLPYTTQLIPLAAICAVIGESVFNKPRTQKVLEQWFWCGIFGEMYGGANETRFANDIEDVVAAINEGVSLNRTINAAYFSATRLLTLQTRLSAAYKGIMALLYKKGCIDFMNDTTMDVVKSMDGNPDIHHIFPEAYCKEHGFPKEKWNSIVNKTPLLAASNRAIGGQAPSRYCETILEKADIEESELKRRLETHYIDYDAFMADDFEGYFIARAKALLKIIEDVMGKAIADKSSEQTIKQYGCSLDD